MACVTGIDPGNKDSAWVRYADYMKVVVESGIGPNAKIAAIISEKARKADGRDILAIELIRSSYGKPAGPELFDTAFHAGYFAGLWREHRPPETLMLIPRLDIRVHLCGTAKAGDPDVRASLIARLGKAATAGITTHRWSALAVALVAADRLKCGMRGKEQDMGICA